MTSSKALTSYVQAAGGNKHPWSALLNSARAALTRRLCCPLLDAERGAGVPQVMDPDAKVVYLIEFDDVEVKPAPLDPAKRIGPVRIMNHESARRLIDGQVENPSPSRRQDH